jgi:hypothetical protein
VSALLSDEQFDSANDGTEPIPQPPVRTASKADRPAGTDVLPTSMGTASRLDDPSLNVAAALIDDLERARISAQHRLRILTLPQDVADEDGEFRGHGVPESDPVAVTTSKLIEALKAVEHDAELALKRTMRKHPLGPWVAATPGVGEKQAARLLAAIGDPYWNATGNKPRTVSALWAYCGLHTLPADRGTNATQSCIVGGDSNLPSGHQAPDARSRFAAGNQLPADQTTRENQRRYVGGDQTDAARPNQLQLDARQRNEGLGGVPQAGGSNPGQTALDTQVAAARVAARRRKGQQANWSTNAKTRAYLIVASCIKVDGKPDKNGKPRALSPYRAKYDERRAWTEVTHPDWTAGHAHNDAMRVASKELLKDLWTVARDLRGGDS